MKKTVFLTLFAVSLTAIVSSPIRAQDINEPNNDILSATPINCGSLTTAYIQTIGDKDWYEVQVPQTGTVSASIINAPNNLDLNLEWHQLNGGIQELVALDDDLNAGGGQQVTATAVIPAGTYYLLIEEEDNNTANTTFSYSFVVTCDASPFELNQNIAEASLIPADTCFDERIWGNNQFYFSSTYGADDQDWYAVTIQENGYLKGDLIVPAGIDMNFELYRDDSPLPVLLADDGDLSASPGQDLSFSAYLEAGTYYYHIEDEQNNATSDQYYTFCTEFEPSQFEVNQTFDLATLIPADTCFEEKILGENADYFNSTDGADDQDWFEINLTESGYLSVELIVPGAIDMNMELYREDGFAPLLVQDDGDFSASPGQDLSLVSFLDVGTYFLHLEDEQNNTLLDEFYQLCLSFEPNEFEVNQSIELAALIPPDTCFQERLWGENFEFETSQEGDNDQDWYQFSVSDSCALLVQITNVPSNLDLNAVILQLNGIQEILIADDGDINSNGGQPLEIQSILEAGTYYLHVEDENHDDLSEELFNICVSCDLLNNTNSISELDNELLILPNPASDHITILGLEGGSYVIYDQTGRFVHSGELQQVLDISKLQSGVYLIQLESSDQSIPKRFVKE